MNLSVIFVAILIQDEGHVKSMYLEKRDSSVA